MITVLGRKVRLITVLGREGEREVREGWWAGRVTIMLVTCEGREGNDNGGIRDGEEETETKIR